MTPHDGALCRCGNRGCLETYISERVLLEMAEQVHPELTSGRNDPLKVIFDAARDGHLGLIELLEDRAYYVGLALANLVNVLNPQLIMLGGWLHDAFDLIEPVVQRTLRRHAFGGIGNQVDVLPSSFGSYGGVTGAATLALEAHFFGRGIAPHAPLEPAHAPWAQTPGQSLD
jgi:predicted NBD/HSP70 family sugar kinase